MFSKPFFVFRYRGLIERELTQVTKDETLVQAGFSALFFSFGLLTAIGRRSGRRDRRAFRCFAQAKPPITLTTQDNVVCALGRRGGCVVPRLAVLKIRMKL